MRLLLPLLVIAVLSSPAHAGREWAFGAGGSLAHAGPDPALVFSISWAHELGPRSDLVVRGEGLLDTDRLSESVLKEAGWGVDVGLRRFLNAGGPVRLSVAGALGPRLYFEPGLGAVARLTAAAHVPLGGSLSLALALAAEAGVARIGDENPTTELQRRGDLTLWVASRF